MLFPTHASARPYNPVFEAGIVGLYNSPEGYVYNDAAIPIEVPNVALKSGQLLKAKSGEFNRKTGSREWGAGQPTPRGLGVDLDTAVTYSVRRYAGKVGEVLDPAVDDGLLVPGGLAKVNLMAEVERMKLERETNLAALCVSGQVTSPTTLAGGQGWNETGGDPFGNITDACKTVSESGHNADTILMGRSAWWALMNNDAVKARMATTAGQHGMGLDNFRETMLSLYGIRNILICNARVNSANQGAAASMADVIGDSVIVYHRGNGGEPVNTEGGVSMLPGWLARVRAYDLYLDNWIDEDSEVRWHRARFAEALVVSEKAYASGIFNVVV